MGKVVVAADVVVAVAVVAMAEVEAAVTPAHQNAINNQS